MQTCGPLRCTPRIALESRTQMRGKKRRQNHPYLLHLNPPSVPHAVHLRVHEVDPHGVLAPGRAGRPHAELARVAGSHGGRVEVVAAGDWKFFAFAGSRMCIADCSSKMFPIAKDRGTAVSVQLRLNVPKLSYSVHYSHLTLR